MREQADVVVVGGGILGCSAALHLAEADVGDVLLLERDEFADGTTAAGAGFLTQWGRRPADLATAHATWDEDRVAKMREARIALDDYGMEFYSGLAGSGADFGFRQNGMLWIASTQAAWDEHLAEMATLLSSDSRILAGGDLVELAPIVDPDGVHRALYQPEAAQLNAPAATLAVAHRAREDGARVRTHRPVTGLRVEGGRVVGVDTRWGPIDAGTVVLTAGAWTNMLLAEVGQFLPMMPFTVSRLITQPIGVPDTMPLLTLPEYHGLWAREWQGGVLYGTDFGGPPRYTYSRGEVPKRFDQLPLDGLWQMQEHAAAAEAVLPDLARTLSLTPAHGMPCLTPDGVGLVGPVPGLGGLWALAGCNALGISHGPGYGKVLADLVVDGGTSGMLDATLLAPDRFADRYASLDDVVEHTKELHADRRGRETGPALSPA